MNRDELAGKRGCENRVALTHAVIPNAAGAATVVLTVAGCAGTAGIGRVVATGAAISMVLQVVPHFAADRVLGRKTTPVNAIYYVAGSAVRGAVAVPRSTATRIVVQSVVRAVKTPTQATVRKIRGYFGRSVVQVVQLLDAESTRLRRVTWFVSLPLASLAGLLAMIGVGQPATLIGMLVFVTWFGTVESLEPRRRSRWRCRRRRTTPQGARQLTDTTGSVTFIELGSGPYALPWVGSCRETQFRVAVATTRPGRVAHSGRTA